MATWKITINGKGIRKASVEKLAEKLKSEFGDDAGISVVDATPPSSRSDRFQSALNDISNGRGELESLRDELQEWLDNLPENFQQGDKGQELEESISTLEDMIGELENTEGSEVNFPGMY